MKLFIRNIFLKRCVAVSLAMALLLPGSYANAQVLTASALPQAGAKVPLSQAFVPSELAAVTVDPNNPLRFDFYVSEGDAPAVEGKDQYLPLVKDFLTALTIPESQVWVNLSPYEKDRIIDDRFGLTDMGRDLLAQDYLLKQITASLIDPEGGPGKTFWAEVYRQAEERFGTTDIPVDTFNKVWIMPDVAEVYQKDTTAIVLKSRLKVLLESDYVALERAGVVGADLVSSQERADIKSAPTNEMTKSILRQIVVPLIEKEVNEGKNFARLRQIYQALILAAWYKKTMRETFLGRIYVDQSKVKGVDQPDAGENLKIYSRYVEAFHKGAFNYIKDEVDRYSGETIPRKYFSGGWELGKDFSEKTLKVTDKIDNASNNELAGKKLRKVRTDLQRRFGSNEFNKLVEDMATRSAIIGRLEKNLEDEETLTRSFDDDLENKVLKEKVKEIEDQRGLLKKQALQALKLFLSEIDQQMPSVDLKGNATRDIFVKGFFEWVFKSDASSSLRQMMLDGEHTEAVFRQFLVIAELMKEPGNIPVENVIRLIGLKNEYVDVVTKIVKAFSSEEQIAAFYVKAYEQGLPLGEKASIFAKKTKIDNTKSVIVNRLKDKSRSYWSQSVNSSGRFRKQAIEAAVDEVNLIHEDLVRFVRKWVSGGDGNLAFMPLKTKSSATNKVYQQGLTIAEILDLLRWRVIYPDMLALEEAVQTFLSYADEYDLWVDKVQEQIKDENKRLLNNKLDKVTRNNIEKTMASLELKLKKKSRDFGILLTEFDNKFHTNLHKKYYVAVHVGTIIPNEKRGENNAVAEGQFTFLNAAIAQYFDHEFIYKEIGFSQFINNDLIYQDEIHGDGFKDAIRRDNWLVILLETLNYLSDGSKLGNTKVKNFLDDYAKKLGIDNAATLQGGIDARNVESALNVKGQMGSFSTNALSGRSLDGIDGFAPEIMSVTPVQGLSFLKEPEMIQGVFSRN